MICLPKLRKSKFICAVFILLNITVLIYFVNKDKFWPEEKDSYLMERNVEKLITAVIYDFEHFENDVPNTVKSLLKFNPSLNIVIVSNDRPYPPLKLPDDNIKLVVLNVPVNESRDEVRLNRFISTKYTLFVPDGFHLKDANGLQKMVHILKSYGKSYMVAVGAEGQSNPPSCEKLHFDYRRWTLTYSYTNNIRYCNSVDGKAAILIQTSNLQMLNTVFIQPFLKALFIQSVLKKLRIRLVSATSFFIEEQQFFRSVHNRWKHERNRKNQLEQLYKRFGIKKINQKDGGTEWLGCTKQTSRCFGTIVDDVPSYIYNDRWTPPCCLRNLRETTRHVLRTFEENNVVYWLEGGSLLGAVRHGDIIPWDYDVDIGMYKKDIEKIPFLKRAKNGEKVVDENKFVWEKSKEGEFFRVQFSNYNHMHVDIFPFYEKNGIMTKDTWFKTHRQDTEFPVKYLQPLDRLKFVGIDVYVPNNYKEFLEFKFGKGVIENPKYPNSHRVNMKKA